MQNTYFLRNREREKLTPNDKHVGKAGGTDIVIKSRHLITTVIGSIKSNSNLSRNVGKEAKNEITATLPRIKMNFPESFLNEI